MAIVRLDKIISDNGLATRSEAKKIIRAGRVQVDGVPVTDSDARINSDLSEILFDGRAISSGSHRYIMLNKPDGALSATEDREQKTVIDLLSPELGRCGLFPVGRLDKDTTGLLLLTNDGDFCHRVTSPRQMISKVYEVFTGERLLAEDAKKFGGGIILRDGTHCLAAELKIDGNNTRHAYVKIYEGKYHQIKRMFAAVGKPVLKLKRISIGGLKLDEALDFGEYRELNRTEIELIFQENVTD
ncbi:MAG: pseudouridine synthase [Oscillospiraceae bacterium]